ncbi:MAG: response regulator [Lachnospiraceae bacterium]|nr:response regulator [Lachnospiraceae bacterium]
MTYDEIIFNRFAGPAIILQYDGETVINLKFNDKYLPELGMNIAEEDYLNADPLSAFGDADKAVYLSALHRCVQTGNDTTCETWRKLMSNCCGADMIYIKSRFVFVESSNGLAVVYETIRNITPEQRTLEALTDSERRYKLASEQINIYNWEYTIATKEMRPCYRCMRDLGLPALVRNYPEPAIEMGIFPPDYADMYREMMRKVDAGIPEIEADIPLTVGRVPFRVKYTTEFDENGKPVKAFGSATLISETELKQIKLDNNIIETLAEEYTCIYLADLYKKDLKVIKQDDLFDIERSGKTYIDIANLIVPKLVVYSGSYAEKLLDVDYVQKSLFNDCDRREFNYKDDNIGRWIRVNFQVVERVDSDVSMLLITCSIIDDLRAKKMDADRLIAVQKQELEARQEMLIKAVDEANRANSAKTAFFSNMSHDIRTPMSAITGFSKLALEEIDNKEHVKDYVEKIISASDHLLSLIKDILDMSRIESGKMDINPVPSNLKNLCRECAEMIRDSVIDKGLEYEVDIDGVGDGNVYCDKLRFRQIVLNLLSNAYKFTPGGGKVSFIAKKISDKDKPLYEIKVKDTGIGMSPEFKEKIWEAFSREENDIVRETQGTGLGMLIVKNIVNLMQGTISLETELGKGSEFTVVIPLKVCKEDGVSVEKTAVKSAALEKRYDGKTILLVDDTNVNRTLATLVLKKFGFTVKETSSGIDAVEIVKNSKPGDIDLVLMDIEMPVMNGLEATRKIRALEDPVLSKIPIVAMTANAFESDIQATKEAGMNAHVTKPCVKDDLINKIDANL